MATTQSLVNYYTGLLIRQYATKPKAIAHIAALVTPALMDQMPLAVMNGFGLTTAIGKQLDIIGKYIGASRTATLSTGVVSLSDADYLTLLQFVISSNSSNGSLYTIQTQLAKYFPGQIYVYDLGALQMSYFINSSIGSQTLLKVLAKQNLLPRPMGVMLTSTISAANLSNFFTFRSYPLAAQVGQPFNRYGSIQSTWTWLSYANIITT